MKAWEIAHDLFSNAVPVILKEDDQGWKALKSVSDFYEQLTLLDWHSNVPGSGAPEKIMVASIQALENRGYIVENGYDLLDKGYKALEENNMIELIKISAELKNAFLNAKKNEESDYWKYTQYKSFEQYNQKISFENYNYPEIDVNSEKFKDQIKAAWLSQLIGAAMGTMVEGYTYENLYNAFGNINGYIREPNTFNDDITFELAFLDAFKEHGYEVTSKHIALSWIGLIPCGWSAEEIALRNIRAGMFPPQSAEFNNPFSEWIGAQMRGAVCGMVAPGNPYLASKLAWRDGEVSHINNGILGEIFNAVMVSLSFVMSDVQKIVKSSINLIPNDSEYYSVINFAYQSCLNNNTYQDALKECSEKYKKYNWIHEYPNVCCEIIALYFGEGDYEKTLNIITMCGWDADCNAGMIMPIIGIQKGMRIIPQRLIHQAFNNLITYMRGYEEIKLEDLVDDTLYYIKKAKNK